MRIYSPFFETIHDEHQPNYNLGRGTHSSILRATVFHDPSGKPLNRAAPHKFAIIWDEDHDERVIFVIEEIYNAGLLPCFTIFGERKAFFTAIMVDNNEPLRSALADRVQRIVSWLPGGDAWSCAIGSIGDPEAKPVHADDQSVELYLRNLTRLWALGPDQWPQTPQEQEPRVVDALLGSAAWRAHCLPHEAHGR